MKGREREGGKERERWKEGKEREGRREGRKGEGGRKGKEKGREGWREDRRKGVT